jgi:phage terminase small subunit
MNKKIASAVDIHPKAKILVDTLVSTGCTIKEASLIAGYKGNSARVNGSKMLHKPEVQKYMMQVINQTLGISSAKAVNKLMSLSSGAKSEYVQLEASKDILDRAGFKAPDKHQHLVAGDFKVTIDLG